MFLRVFEFSKRMIAFFLDFYPKVLFRKWFGEKFGMVSHCYISQNCIGGRFYELQNRAYTSPTVGLWFEPSDFIKFCENIAESLTLRLECDPFESKVMGYPVGRLNGIKILFQHYPTFDAAKIAWEKRASRVDVNNIFILMTDRDGFKECDREAFNRLPTNRKILFSHQPFPEMPNAIYVPGYEKDGCVGSLYGSYGKLNGSSVRADLLRLLSN